MWNFAVIWFAGAKGSVSWLIRLTVLSSSVWVNALEVWVCCWGDPLCLKVCVNSKSWGRAGHDTSDIRRPSVAPLIWEELLSKWDLEVYPRAPASSPAVSAGLCTGQCRPPPPCHGAFVLTLALSVHFLMIHRVTAGSLGNITEL